MKTETEKKAVKQSGYQWNQSDKWFALETDVSEDVSDEKEVHHAERQTDQSCLSRFDSGA